MEVPIAGEWENNPNGVKNIRATGLPVQCLLRRNDLIPYVNLILRERAISLRQVKTEIINSLSLTSQLPLVRFQAILSHPTGMGGDPVLSLSLIHI